MLKHSSLKEKGEHLCTKRHIIALSEKLKHKDKNILQISITISPGINLRQKVWFQGYFNDDI